MIQFPYMVLKMLETCTKETVLYKIWIHMKATPLDAPLEVYQLGIKCQARWENQIVSMETEPLPPLGLPRNGLLFPDNHPGKDMLFRQQMLVNRVHTYVLGWLTKVAEDNAKSQKK